MTTLHVYVGHGNPTGEIQILGFDPTTGALAPQVTVATGSSTSYLAFHPSGRFAYTTQNRSNRLGAFAITRDGGLRAINDAAVPARPGETGAGPSDAGPAYVAVDARGRYLIAACYRGHNVVVFPLGDDGAIGPLVTNVSQGQHAHCVCIAPDNRQVFVPYLGSDLVAQHRFDEVTGALAPNDPPAVATARGAGPRHLTFAPDGRRAYLINELDATLVAFDYDAATGRLSQRAAVDSLPAGYGGRRWGADVRVHPSGRFVFVSNRAHDSVSVHDSETLGEIDRVSSEGKTPRNFTLDPAGRFLLVANQDSGNLVTFAIDPATGRLTRIGARAVADNPYYVMFGPPGA